MSNRSRRVRQSLKDQARAAQLSAARFEAAYEMASGLTRELSDRNAELRGILYDAMIEAGELSSLFPPEVRRMNSRRQFDAYPAIRVPRPIELSDLINDKPVYTEDVLHVQELPMMLARVSQDTLRNMTHMRLTFEDKTSAYAISHQALAKMDRKRLEETIARTFVPELVRHFVDQLRPRR